MSNREQMINLVVGPTLQTRFGAGFLEVQPNERLVSVIIPAFGHEQYVGEAIGSVAAQTYSQVEIILIDDGSADRTFETALQALSRVAIPWAALKVGNRGGVVNLNAGIEVAHGGWIAILASDDVQYPEMYRTLLEAAERPRADIAIGLVDEIDQLGRHKLPRSFGKFGEFERPAHARRMILEDHFSVMPQGMLLRRSLFSRIGLFSPEIYTEDFDFMARAFGGNASYVCVPVAVAGHRQTREHVSHAHIEKVKRAALDVVRRHTRRLGEWRRARAVLFYEAAFNKAANGYLAAGLLDLISAWCHSPIRVSRLALCRVLGRIQRKTAGTPYER